MAAVGKKTHDFIIMELFRDVCPVVHHSFILYDAKIAAFCMADMIVITDIYTDFFDLLRPVPDMS